MNEPSNLKTIQKEIPESLYWIREIAISLVVVGHVIGFDQNYGMRKLYESDAGQSGRSGMQSTQFT